MVGVTKLDTKVFLLPRSEKEKHLHEGYFHAENGNIKEAQKSFQKSFNVTEDMIYSVIKVNMNIALSLTSQLIVPNRRWMI